MRTLSIERNERFPPLGWILALREDGRARAIVGDAVHIAPWGFSDGVWPGDLDAPPSALRFGASVVGSHAAAGGRPLVLPASHTVEQVFVGRGKGFLLISNYLPLLSAAEPELLPWRLDWGVRLAELSRGLQTYSRTLHTSGHVRLERYSGHPLVILDDLSIREAPAPLRPAPFVSFEGYREWLLQAMAGVAENADDPRRRRRFPPIATCSAGYDSSAVAVLAREIGCGEALGIAKGRDGTDDAGAAIAAALGIDLHYVDRHPCLDDFDAALPYLASGMSASDYALHDIFLGSRGRLLLTGVHGDVIWRLGAEPSRAAPRGDLSGAGIQAARIHLGLQHLPVPLMGACWHPELSAIALSEEMRSYRIGGAYDRPIPRRIVEEAGVPRAAFGQRKTAANLLCTSEWEALGDPALRRAVEEKVARLSPLQRAGFWTASLWHSGRQQALRHPSLRPGDGAGKLSPARVVRGILRRRRFAEEERNGPLASAEFLTAVEVLGAQFRPIVRSLRHA
jgi:hypothetical protein